MGLNIDFGNRACYA